MTISAATARSGVRAMLATQPLGSGYGIDAITAMRTAPGRFLTAPVRRRNAERSRRGTARRPAARFAVCESAATAYHGARRRDVRMFDLGLSFIASVARDPQAVAIVDGDVRLTY